MRIGAFCGLRKLTLRNASADASTCFCVSSGQTRRMGAKRAE